MSGKTQQASQRSSKADVLGISPATGRPVLKPASRGGSVSLAAIKAAVKRANETLPKK